jgi:hypothetical protein
MQSSKKYQTIFDPLRRKSRVLSSRKSRISTSKVIELDSRPIERTKTRIEKQKSNKKEIQGFKMHQ